MSAADSNRKSQMSKFTLPPKGAISLSRRRFVQGLAAGGSLMGLGLGSRLSQAEDIVHARP